MGQIDRDKRPFVSPGLARAWARGEEQMPEDLREQLKPWSQDGGVLPDPPISYEETEAWFASLPSDNRDLLGEQVLGKQITNIVKDYRSGLPEGTTTWKQAAKGDPIAREAIRRQRRSPKIKPPSAS